MTHRVFCERIDPSNARHDPRYARILERDEVAVSDAENAIRRAKALFDSDYVAVSGCGC